MSLFRDFLFVAKAFTDSLASWSNLLALVITLTIAYLLVLRPIYNIFFHPLHAFPGPKLWASFSIPYTRMSISGSAPMRILELHNQYGQVVRIRPNELSFVNSSASKDLKSQKIIGPGENGKDPAIYGSSAMKYSIMGAERNLHARFRRALAPAFSSKAVLSQEPLIKSYIDLLLSRLNEECAEGTKSLDLCDWFLYFTFDVIGDLAFGESFDCLKSVDNHPWVAKIFGAMQALLYVSLAKLYIPWVDTMLAVIVPKKASAAHQRLGMLAKEKVSRRLALATTRPDLIDAIFNSDQDNNLKLSLPEIGANATILLVAGAETTATALAAAVFCLCRYPATLALLAKEIESSFTTESEINIASVRQLKYLNAVLDEVLRIYPPAPWAQTRVIRVGGDFIAGKFVPEGTVVGVWQWAAHHTRANFTCPHEFVPERWLADVRFDGDQKEAFQPFSSGPRDCIGRNLAYAEMSLVLARLIWNFDLDLNAESRTWMEDSEVFWSWKKPQLKVSLTPKKTR